MNAIFVVIHTALLAACFHATRLHRFGRHGVCWSARRTRNARGITAAGRRIRRYLAVAGSLVGTGWPGLAAAAAAGSLIAGLAGFIGASAVLAVSSGLLAGAVAWPRLLASPRTAWLARNPGLAWCLLAGKQYRRQLRLVLRAHQYARQGLPPGPPQAAGALNPGSPRCAYCRQQIKAIGPHHSIWMSDVRGLSVAACDASPDRHHAPAGATRCCYCHRQIGQGLDLWLSGEHDHVGFCEASPDLRHHPRRIPQVPAVPISGDRDLPLSQEVRRLNGDMCWASELPEGARLVAVDGRWHEVPRDAVTVSAALYEVHKAPRAGAFRIRLVPGPVASPNGGPDPDSLFGERLEWYRVDAGMTRPELEDLAGVSRGLVALLESGRRRPLDATIMRLAAVLDVPSQRLMSAPDLRHIPAGQFECAEHHEDLADLIEEALDFGGRRRPRRRGSEPFQVIVTCPGGHQLTCTGTRTRTGICE